MQECECVSENTNIFAVFPIHANVGNLHGSSNHGQKIQKILKWNLNFFLAGLPIQSLFMGNASAALYITHINKYMLNIKPSIQAKYYEWYVNRSEEVC